MIVQYSVPAKTFLLGEYVVTKGGPALLLSTAPRFVLNVSQQKDAASDVYKIIHPESPGGKLIGRHSDFYRQFNLSFVDPYQGAGGLGASSAQFALLFAMLMQVKDITPAFLDNALNTYKEVAWDQTGTAPSGADVIAQFTGGLCFYHRDKNIVESLVWPFPALDFCLIHTGNKMATHTYLRELADVDTGNMSEVAENACSGLKNANAPLFIKSVNQYAELLKSRHWVTQILLQQGVLAAKGCGAMGADIIFVVLESTVRDNFSAWCSHQNMRVICLGQEMSHGFEQKTLKIS
jgi:mevalonate kinase